MPMYGHINNSSNIIISKDGTYLSNDLTFTPDINNAVILTFNYEQSSNLSVYFSLKVSNLYISVDKDCNVVLSNTKRFFYITHSHIDNSYRSRILSGTKYSVATGIDNIDIEIFKDVVLYPTTWYENINNVCVLRSHIGRLTEDNFKGYTTKQWCDIVPFSNYCNDGEYCGKCLGKCQDPTLICYTNGYEFICGDNKYEPLLDGSTVLPPLSTGTGATIIAVILLVIILALLIWSFKKRN